MKKSLLTAGLASTLALTPISSADTCRSAEDSFLEKVKPVITNPEIIKTDPDNKVYTHINVPTVRVNWMLQNPDAYQMTGTPTETLYPSLQIARNNLSPENILIGEINTNTGHLENIYKRNGENVERLPWGRCSPAPYLFDSTIENI